MKTNWIIFLVVISLAAACTTKDGLWINDIFYENHSDRNIKIVRYGVHIRVGFKYRDTVIVEYLFPNEKIFISNHIRTSGGEVHSVSDARQYLSYFIPEHWGPDSTHILFDSVRYIRLTQEDTKSIYHLDRYVTKKINDISFEHTFTFTEQDYQNALPIN